MDNLHERKSRSKFLRSFSLFEFYFRKYFMSSHALLSLKLNHPPIMKKYFTILFFACLLLHVCIAQTDEINFYKKTSTMISMRDGIKLHTVILSPVGVTQPVPVLLHRTPYGASGSDAADDTT